MRVQKLRACREAPGGNALIENDGLLRGTIAEENSPVDADTVSRPVRNAKPSKQSGFYRSQPGGNLVSAEGIEIRGKT